MIISAFAGSGKTVLAESVPKEVIDLESSDYRWNYTEEATTDREGRKGDTTGRTENPNFVKDYVDAILEADKEYTIVLISCHENILDELLSRGASYTMAIPGRGMKQTFMKRYEDRGNSTGFIESMNEGYDKFVTSMLTRVVENDPVRVVWLTEDKPYLSDVLDIELELKNNFTYHEPTPGKQVKFETIRALGLKLAEYITNECPRGRESAIAQTKIEEAVMWANAGVARENNPE